MAALSYVQYTHALHAWFNAKKDHEKRHEKTTSSSTKRRLSFSLYAIEYDRTSN